MKKTILAVSLTLLLGPGVGHLYLRKFKKAFYLIVLSLIFALQMAWQIGKNISKTDILGIKAADLYRDFYIQHPKLTVFYDIVFAALWAYALVDAYILARRDSKS